MNAMSLFGRSKHPSLVILFNVFCFFFAGFMTLDYFEVNFDFLHLSSLKLAGISIVLAVLTFVAHKSRRPK